MQVDLGKNTPHPSEMENRLAYAQRIVTFLDRHLPRAKAANLAMQNEASWYRIAKLAGEGRMPSKATISAVVAMIHMREQMLADMGSFVPEQRLLSRLPDKPDPDAELV